MQHDAVAAEGERDSLHVNYEYTLSWAARVASGNADAQTLDYGCGSGTTVAAGRARGLDLFGTDLFNTSSRAEEVAAERGLLGNAVRKLDEDGRIPYDAGTFDLVVTNQVFEHVEDLDFVAAEIARVLKPGGRLLALFPSRGVLREGHTGIPLMHWFPAGSPIRERYMAGLRRVGLGYFKDERSPTTWAEEMSAWMDAFTFYRSKREIMRTLRRHFEVRGIEPDYVRFRLGEAGARGVVARAADSRPLGPIVAFLLRRLSGMVLLATVRDAPQAGRPLPPISSS